MRNPATLTGMTTTHHVLPDLAEQRTLYVIQTAEGFAGCLLANGPLLTDLPLWNAYAFRTTERAAQWAQAAGMDTAAFWIIESSI